MSDVERSSNLVIPVDKVPVAAFQAIYHQLTKRTETLSKSYEGSFKIRKNDLDDLYRQLDQSITQYQLKGSHCNVSLVLSNGEAHTFSAFEKFSMMNFDAFTQKTTSVGIEYDFLVVLPRDDERTTEISQRYKIRLSISSADDEVADLVVYPSRLVRNIRIGFVPIRTTIEYSDYAVARHVQALLNDWVERVRFSDENIISEKASKWAKRSGAYAILALIATAFLGAVFFEPSAYLNIVTPMRFLILVLTIAVFSVGFGIYFSEKVDKLVELLSPQTSILLTHGDVESRAELMTKRLKAKMSLKFVFVGIFITMVISILANLISSFLLTGR